jgi:hypothetical protein
MTRTVFTRGRWEWRGTSVCGGARLRDFASCSGRGRRHKSYVQRSRSWGMAPHAIALGRDALPLSCSTSGAARAVHVRFRTEPRYTPRGAVRSAYARLP